MNKLSYVPIKNSPVLPCVACRAKHVVSFCETAGLYIDDEGEERQLWRCPKCGQRYHFRDEGFMKFEGKGSGKL